MKPRNRRRSSWATPRPAIKPAHINTHFAYVGGGFGGRDHTPFPLYLALAAMFFPGHAVRLAYNRYRAIPIGDQAERFLDAHADGGRSGHRQNLRVRGRSCVARRRPRQFRAASGDGRRRSGARHLLGPESRRHHGGAALARRDHGLDAELWHAAVDDGARGAGRRDVLGVAARSHRVPAAQRAQGWRAHHNWKPLQHLDPNAGDSGQAGETSDLAAACRGEGARTVAVARRHRRRLRHQELRHRQRLLAWNGGNRSGGPDRHPLRGHGDGDARSGRRSPTGSLSIWAASPTKSHWLRSKRSPRSRW